MTSAPRAGRGCAVACVYQHADAGFADQLANCRRCIDTFTIRGSCQQHHMRPCSVKMPGATWTNRHGSTRRWSWEGTLLVIPRRGAQDVLVADMPSRRRLDDMPRCYPRHFVC